MKCLIKFAIRRWIKLSLFMQRVYYTLGSTAGTFRVLPSMHLVCAFRRSLRLANKQTVSIKVPPSKTFCTLPFVFPM